jgi:hypothetical protein
MDEHLSWLVHLWLGADSHHLFAQLEDLLIAWGGRYHE